MADLLKNAFFDDFDPPNPGKSSLSDLVPYRTRSGVVELVGRGPLIFARVENGATKFSPKKQKNAKILDQTRQFSVGNFHFLAAEKLTFGGGITSKLAS